MKLIYACSDGDFTTVKELLANGYDPNFQCELEMFYGDGITPLHVVCMCITANIDCFTELLRIGANVNIQDSKGRTPLGYAVIRSNLSICEELLKLQSDLNIQDNNGYTVIHIASMFNNINCMKIILSYNVNIYLKDHHGHTALDIANDNNHSEIVNLLNDYEFPTKWAIDE
jgi:ankyrin repeat protein